MGLGGCFTCIKYLMFAFNFLFWLLGCAILGVGLWMRFDPEFRVYFEGQSGVQSLYTAAYILIAVGAIIMVLGFLGCCGAIRESQCMLVTFFIFLFIIFIILLAAGIYVVVNKEMFEEQVKEMLLQWIAKYKQGDQVAKDYMDQLQEKLSCCGAEGPLDYAPDLPPASCPTVLSLAGQAPGCKDALFNLLLDNIQIVAGVAIGIGLVMIFGMIFSMMLCCAIRDTKA